MQNNTSTNARSIRKEKKMSLKELSEKSGLSMAYLSNFENGKVNITIASLYQIAKALDVSVKALLATEEDKNILVVPSDKRFAIVEDSEHEFPPIQEFLTRGASFDMQVTVMHMSPHTDSGKPKTHDSEEFVYVLKGSVTVCIGETNHIKLKEGDFAYYSALNLHYWMNDSDESTDFLAVASRKGF